MITDRIDNITHIKNANTILPAPGSVKIELTGKCNFRCHFCAAALNLRSKQEMERSLYSRLIREMREAGVGELGLFYLGESLLCQWLPEAIMEAKEIGFPYVFLTTNGSLASKRKIRALFSAGLDSLKFSFNYSDPDQLQEIAKVKPSLYETIITNIKNAYQIRSENGFRCGLYASYIEYDGQQGEKMQQAVAKIKDYVDEVYTLPLYNQADLVSDREKEKGWTASPGNRGRADNLVDPLPCWAVFTEGHITADGKLSACCFDHNDALTMADLTQTTFMDGWNSDRFQALRQAHLNKEVTDTPCNHCVIQ